MNTIEIKLRGRAYQISCPPEEQAALQEAAQFLDERLHEFAAKTGGSGERLAMMTALNLAHELLHIKTSGAVIIDTKSQRRIEALSARLDSLLEK